MQANQPSSSARPQTRLMQNRVYLYATGFFSGMSVMAIELGASRLLAPYFSSSQIVWTVIIGTIMIAMAIGNIWGGRTADKDPDPGRLYRRLLIAAIWTAAIPFVGKYVIAGISFLLMLFVRQNFLIWASLATCLVLFVFPLMLLGATTPSLIKYTTTNLEDNGRIVGELEAFGTIGSIIGTFLPTFVTIPTVGTAMTFLIFAAVLAILSLIYFISVKAHRVRGAVAAILIVALLFIPVNYSFAFWESDLLYEGESIYNYLRVREDDEKIILSTNVLEGIQSVMMKKEGLTGMYYDVALAAPLMNTQKGNDQDVLILGLGTGTYARQCMRYFPGISVEGVEIDQKIVDLAYKYFALPQDVKVTVEDGRAYLRTAGKYDVIMVDAYQDITIPFQMSSVEFFTMVREHLNPGGVMVVNMNMRSSSSGAINDYLSDTIASVFPQVATAVTENNTNVELFAGEDPDMWTGFAKKCASLADGTELKAGMQPVLQNLTLVKGGDLVLTDDRAPVEVLGMRVLDELIADSIDYYKDMLTIDNIRQMLN